jgi:uncharacterized protein
MAVTEFTPFVSALGGALVGVAAVLLMLFSGRIAGVSGIVGRLIPPYGDAGVLEALVFVLGLIAAPMAYMWVTGTAAVQTVSSNIPLMIAAGLLVGFGAGLSGGCTSGHGVCGLSRLSPRSLVATLTFMATAFATVFIVRHVIGG